MIEVVYITLFVMITLFLSNAYLLFFSKPKAYGDTKAVIDAWLKSLFIFIIALIVFFLFFGTAMNTIQEVKTWNFNDGSPDVTYTDNNYLDALTFFPFMIAMLTFNFVFLVAQVFKEFKTFGQTNFSKKHSGGFKH